MIRPRYRLDIDGRHPPAAAAATRHNWDELCHVAPLTLVQRDAVIGRQFCNPSCRPERGAADSFPPSADISTVHTNAATEAMVGTGRSWAMPTGSSLACATPKDVRPRSATSKSSHQED